MPAVWAFPKVFMSNVYGRRLRKHFHCGHNISSDPLLLLTLRAIGGLSVDSLSETEQETAANAIAEGYLQRRDNRLYPKVVVIAQERQGDFSALLDGAKLGLSAIASRYAPPLGKAMRSRIPPHLLPDYSYLLMLTVTPVLNRLIEECLTKNLLTLPTGEGDAEGVLIEVQS